MSDCPGGGCPGAAVTAAPGAAATPTAATGAPSVATATAALHLARAVLGFSANEKATAAVGKGGGGALVRPAPGDGTSASSSAPMRRGVSATESFQTQEETISEAAAALFPSEELLTVPSSSDVATHPEPLEGAARGEGETAKSTACGVTEAEYTVAQPPAATSRGGYSAAEQRCCTPATAASAFATTVPVGPLTAHAVTAAATATLEATVERSPSAAAASGLFRGDSRRQTDVDHFCLGGAPKRAAEATHIVTAAGDENAACDSPQTAPALAAALVSRAAIGRAAAPESGGKLSAVLSSAVAATAAPWSTDLQWRVADSPYSAAPTAGDSVAASISTAAAGTSAETTVASTAAGDLATAAGTFAGRGLKRAPAEGVILDETTTREISKSASESGEGVTLLTRLLHQKSCLIITDVQNDFCEGGALGGSGRRAVITRINQLRCLSISANRKHQQKQKHRQQQQYHEEERKERSEFLSGPAGGDATLMLTTGNAFLSKKSVAAAARESAAAAVCGTAEDCGASEICKVTEKAMEAAEAPAAERTATAGERAGAATEEKLEEINSLFDVVVVSQDWHPPDHASFISSHSSNCNPYACCCGDSPSISRIPSSSAAGGVGASDEAAPEAAEEEAAAGKVSAALADAGEDGGGAAAPETRGAGGGEAGTRLAQSAARGAASTAAAPIEGERQPEAARSDKKGGEESKPQQVQQQISLDEGGGKQQEQGQDQQLQVKTGKRVRRASTHVLLDLWPVHCVQHTFGAALHDALLTRPTDVYIKKGTRRGVENYSCFGSHWEDTGLTGVLCRERVEVIVIVGFTTEYCVRATAFSALQVPGIKAVYVLTDCCCSIDPEQQDAVFKGMQQRGVRLCSLQQLLSSIT